MRGSQKRMVNSVNLTEVLRDTRIVVVTNYCNLKAIRAHLLKILP